MFGHDDSLLARVRAREDARRSAWFRVWVLLLQLVLAGLCWGAAKAVALSEQDWVVSDLIEQLAPGRKGRLRFRQVVVLPVGDWREPSTWRVALEDLAFTPNDPTRPSWTVDQVVVAVPDLQALRTGTVHLPWARVSGLQITAVQQRPPPPWQPEAREFSDIVVDELEVWGASYTAPADPPLGVAELDGLYGTLRQVRHRPGHREVTGRGSLRAQRFLTGSIELFDVNLPRFELVKSTLRFDGDFDFVGVRGVVEAEVLHFHTGSDATFKVSMSGLKLSDIVRTATGTTAPIDGILDLDLLVKSGGELPRGGARMDGNLILRDASLQLASNTRYLILDLIRLAPSLRLDADNKVHLGDSKGKIKVQRGRVDVQQLLYNVGKRQVEVRGHIDDDDMAFTARLRPKRDPDTRPGVGIVLYGSPRKPLVRFAKRDDLLPGGG